MKSLQGFSAFLVVLLLLVNGALYRASADHDEMKKRSWYQKIFEDNRGDDDHDGGGKKRRYRKRCRNESEHYGKCCLAPENNPTYSEECGACHFLYQPALLPSGSWNKILAGLDDHFGESVVLDSDSKKIIGEYLKVNAAERSTAKCAVRIMRSVGEKTPLRITEIPYIKEKHHEIPIEVLKRESIGSLSNCSACHKTAEKGIYDDDSVGIPR